ncbi:MAG: hypothetical protein QW677_10340 [Pyrobaculum sp.]|uniref:Uncharacterized protein n=2 Tax=Pyrobaculum arsenaticum TaxID=121277 RepID=A4WK49_PYRAR|nr:hypothetical protein [Pyrobaculum arsenaticum]ABP50766.1 conserved hypothetical protein [Pyrobaculum arsenaticum DSM 13514]MCY0891228.1 hypothetical protein [Pyrobaculum arsenaticum]NYR15517.1 hypothetical protein [Pyrobaculum arsenaticum]
MIGLAAGVLLLAVAFFEPGIRPVAFPMGLFFLAHGVGGYLHKKRRHLAGYLATFAGIAAAIWLIPLPLGDWRRALLVGVAFGFFLHFARFFMGRAGRYLAPVPAAVASGFLGLFLQSAGIPALPQVVWGVGAGGSLASALGLLRGPVGRFFAKRVVFFGIVGGLAAALYVISPLVGRPLYLAAVAAAAVAALAPGMGGPKKPRLYDDPDILEAKRVEARFVKNGDVALLAAYVAYHLARAGADEKAVVDAVRVALSYRDLEPSPFAPAAVARLVERANRRRRARHLERVKSYLRRYL